MPPGICDLEYHVTYVSVASDVGVLNTQALTCPDTTQIYE